ncbi:hypothetical protein K1X84_07220, partial [bacterium]|nr:hypothetical protein [bacterium]
NKGNLKMALQTFIDIIKLIPEILLLFGKKKEKAVDALVSLRNAIRETRKFIAESGYEPNTDLSMLWLDAFGKIKKAGIYSESEFPDSLYHKARFWENPKMWLRESGSLELIPTLIQLENECDLLFEKIK